MTILKRPIVSEKSMRLASLGLYTFEVDKDATKFQVGKAVAEKFNVKVISVKTINVKGQIKSQRKVRKSYRAQGMRKAIVRLQKGQTLAIFETPKEQQEEVVVTTGEGEPIRIKEKKDLLGKTKVRVDKTAVGAAPTTQRKVITGK